MHADKIYIAGDKLQKPISQVNFHGGPISVFQTVTYSLGPDVR